jgi:hypothetical protein
MKHAGSDALDALEPVLAELRKLDGLKEKKRGTFYRGSSAFLHFHEDPAGFFADVKLDGNDFVRLRVNSTKEVATLISKARRALLA